MLKENKDMIKHIIFIIALFLSYIFTTSVSVVMISDISPLIIICVLVSISMFHNILISCIYAFIGGILCDIMFNSQIGVSSILLVTCCAFISVFTIYCFKINLHSFIIFNSILLILQYIFITYFKYIKLGISQWNLFWTHNALPSIALTVIISPLIFFFFKYVNEKFM